MSKKTFFDAIKPHILRRGDKPTKKEFKKLAKKTTEIGKEYAEEDGNVFDSVDFDRYYLTANPCNVVAERKALTEFHRGMEDVVFVPTFMLDEPSMLMSIYNGVVVNGEAYSTRHPRIQQTLDTNNYIHVNDGYEVMGRGLYEHNDDLVQIGDDDHWAREKDVVMTEDMGYPWYKGDCYTYHDDEGDRKYYRYRNMAPDAGRRILRFEEARFPDPEEINESRIGVELEYLSAVDTSVATLKSKRFRRIWNSVRDGSIVPNDVPRDQEKATEFVSIPLKIEEVEEEVTDFMQFAQRHGSRTSDRCGFHVHIGQPNMDFHDLTSLVVLCESLEKDLFRLVPNHRQNNEYCKRLDSSFKGFRRFHKGELKDEEEVAEIFYEGKATAKSRAQQGKWNVGGKRHHWLSVDRYWYCRDEPHKRTVEFRMHHSTHKAKEFVQFILLCYYIAQFAFNKPTSVCLNADLGDVVESIRNTDHYNKVSNLLRSKKVITKQ